MSAPEAGPARPLAPFVKIDAGGKPYLEGFRCTACGEILAVSSRRACPNCTAVGMLEPIRLAERGKLYTYTVVHRSFPGIATPFIAALVDLEGGGTIKGTVVGVETGAICFDMPLRVEFETLNISGDSSGQYVRHFFTTTGQ